MIEAWRALAAVWWQTIAPNAVHVIVLGVLVLAVDRLLPRRTWPEVRHGLWLLVLARLVLPPTLGSPWSLAYGPWGEPSSVLEAAARSVEASDTIAAWGHAVVALWLVGAVVLGGHLAWRYRRWVRHWRRQSTKGVPEALLAPARSAAQRLGLRRVPTLRLLSATTGPFVVGMVRPTVYLPVNLDTTRAEHVLLHEFGHLVRRDHWSAGVGLFLHVVYWFHPGVWLVQRRLDALREQCCDRTVARALGGQTADYRQTLLFFLARRLESSGGPGLGFFRPRSVLLDRLRQLESNIVVEPSWLRRTAIGAAVASLLVVGLPAARAADQAVHQIAEIIERPPGCLTLRYLVLRRLATGTQADRRHGVLADRRGATSAASGVTQPKPPLPSTPEEDFSDDDFPTRGAPPADPPVPRIRW